MYIHKVRVLDKELNRNAMLIYFIYLSRALTAKDIYLKNNVKEQSLVSFICERLSGNLGVGLM